MQDFFTQISQYSQMRLALLADEQQRRIEALEQAHHAPVAIVGIGCRLPGDVDTPERFWDLLQRGVDAITEVPADRWDIGDYYDPDPDAPGKMSSRWGGFVGDVSGFDAHFFGISPREAQHMDPQQRLLMEVAWEALEHAAINPGSLDGTKTGVFVGLSAVDYLQLLRDRGLPSFDAYTASGAAHSIASGRLSYFLGAQGPSLSIDTACSSSLVAIHQAVQSLRRHESDLALAGGVNLLLRPDVTIALSRAHMMAPDGRCKVFDRRADGFVRSEGCGLLVLKRLTDARADGDQIIAVIRGSASNQDGRSNGLTAPNGAAQEAVLRAALADARLDPAEVQFVETHGTGTSLGDPIEVNALATVFRGDRPHGDRLVVGAVKANIGHPEAAAGVAAVIKAALAVHHASIPPQLHFAEPNPHIPWDEIPVDVARTPMPWPPAPNDTRIAGVSSFGFSGANVHLLLSSEPAVQRVPPTNERPLHILTLSARSEDARSVLAERYVAELQASTGSLADIAFTANSGRASLAYRLAVVGATREEVAAKLTAVATGEANPAVARGNVPPRAPRIAFLFTGQGSQYAGMAKILYQTQPFFREVLDRCDALLRPHLGHPLPSILFPEGRAPLLLDRTEYIQPALFAVEYALAQLWQSWGIRPTALLGHSLGEYVAATVGGMIGLEDALTLVAARGQIMGALPPGGAMAAVMTDERAVREMIEPWRRDVSVAAINGPQHTVISGSDAAVSAVIERATVLGLDALRLPVAHAFHSPLMEPIRSRLARACGAVSFRPAEIDVISNVTGERLAGRTPDASYWMEHALAPVQFARGIQALVAAGCDTFVEIGPQPTLIGMARRCLPPDATLAPSLRRGRDDWATLLDSLATLYVKGAPVDWKGFDAGYGRQKLVLPRYPFQRERYWADPIAQPLGPVANERIVPKRVSEMMYEVVWREAPAAGADLLSPTALQTIIEPRVDATAREVDLRSYEPFKSALDRLTTLFVIRALRELGADLPVGTVFAAEALADRLGVTKLHRRLFARLLTILGEDGFLEPTDSSWRVRQPLVGDDPVAESERLHRTHPAGAAELTVTIRCARELALVLREQIDPLSLLFPDGSQADMERLYRTSAPALVYNRLIADTVVAIERGWSKDRPLRILEIGAGTGSTTASILAALRGPVEYTFTDVTPLFVQRARTAFGDRQGVQFTLLDISADPAAQGFAAGAFDVVIGANVLHATPDVEVSLTHARSLLAPEGLLILLEATTPQRFGDLTVGLLDGWWSYTDLHRRQYALMGRERWCVALAETGFAEQSVIVDAGHGPVLEQQAIFVAQNTAAVVPARPQRWLLVADQGGVAERVAAELRARGDETAFVSVQSATLRDDLQQAMTSGLPAAGVVHLAALDATLNEATTSVRLWSDQEAQITSSLGLAQAMIATTSGALPALWYVTRGAQATSESDAVNPAQAPIWGLGHVLAIEHPELRCHRIDLDLACESDDGVRLLVDELRAGAADDQVAHRGTQRLLRRLVPYEARPTTRPVEIRADGAYLVTGGARGLGLLAAEWLVARGARSLVLMSRRPADASTDARCRALEASGARVKIVAGDVSIEADVRRVLDEIAASMPPVRGIIHAAGVLDDGAVISQRWERFATVMAPKVLGTWHLHRLAGPLDFFAFFSSGASVAGSAGQVNHAAANAFEDAMAWYRASQGQPTVSINWGAWAEVGTAADRDITGGGFLRKIAPSDGLLALGQSLQMPEVRGRLSYTQLAVLTVDWPALAKAPAAWSANPLFRELLSQGPRSESPISAIESTYQPSLREVLQSVAPNRRLNALRERVRLLTIRVLGIQATEAFDANEPLRQLGLDSLMAVELRNLLAASAGVPMPATITFEYPSVAALTAYLAEAAFSDLIPTMGDDDPPAPPPATAVPEWRGSDTPSDNHASSIDELAARLAESLDRLSLEKPQ